MLMADEQVNIPTQAGNVLWPLGDWQGTLRDVVDFNETNNVFEVANHRVYDSFGNLTAETNTNVNLDFGYTGKFYDETTKLSYHWNRWFDPKAGKWISPDPIGFAAGDTNLSRYVGNGSTNFRDPTGRYRIQDPVITVAMSDGRVVQFPATTDPIVIQQLGGQISGGTVATMPGMEFRGPGEMLAVQNDLKEIIAQEREQRRKIAEAAPNGLDYAQGALDVAGFLPGVGAVPDLINAGISVARGNKGEAALSAFAAFPFIGDIAKGVKKADDVADALKAGSKFASEGTSSAARRQAMREAGTPTSRPAISQSGSNGRRQFVTEGADGRPRVQTQHLPDKNHPFPHVHDANPKLDPVTGEIRRGNHGEIKYESGGTVAEFGK